MNIPENILQAVADAAFENAQLTWGHASSARRAVIQHALNNPALAPFLAGGIGEYTDMEIADAWRSANHTMPFVSEIKRFLSALPRRESQALAEATPPFPCAINHTEQNVQFRDAAGYCMICGTDWPDPAAEVPLGPEDVPPGSTLRAAQGHWFIVLHVVATGVTISNVNGSRFIEWHELKDEGWQINISRPDTGRWDANAWKPCSKPGKEVTSENTSH